MYHDHVTLIHLSPHPSFNGLDLPQLLLGVASGVECPRLNDRLPDTWPYPTAYASRNFHGSLSMMAGTSSTHLGYSQIASVRSTKLDLLVELESTKSGFAIRRLDLFGIEQGKLVRLAGLEPARP